MKEVKDIKSICTKDGVLSEYSIGWSNIPFKNCDIKNKFLRRKIWNKYIWIGENFIFNLFIINLDYASILIIDFYDLESKTKINKCMRCGLRKNIVIDSRINSYAYYKDRNRFINILRVNNCLNIDFKWNKIDIVTTIELDYESINVVIPWKYNRFHYTSKHSALENEGYLIVDNKKYELDNSLVYIDYGRGVWQRKKEWIWLTSGFKNEAGETIGINLAAKYTDSTGVNENGIKIDDKIYKIYDDVEFIYDSEINKYSIKSKQSNEVNMCFMPIINNNKVNRVIGFKLKQKQCIGYLNGFINIKDKKIEFNNTIGWIEDNFVKW